MSEETSRKSFRMQKTVPGDVVLVISPMSNPQVSRTIVLTDRNPYQNLPLDWAFGVFMDNGLYHLYKKGCFTFDDNDELVRLAYENGAYFDDKLDFVPANEKTHDEILKIVKGGNRQAIIDANAKYGRDHVLSIVIENRDALNGNIIKMCESIFRTQLFMEEEPDHE